MAGATRPTGVGHARTVRKLRRTAYESFVFPTAAHSVTDRSTPPWAALTATGGDDPDTLARP